MTLIPAPKVTVQGNNRLVTGPVREPVGTAALKAQLKITSTAEDLYIAALLVDTRKFIENITGLAFITQTWKLTMNDWPHGPTEWWSGVREMATSELYARAEAVTLPRFPLQSITSVTTYDEADTATAASLSLFYTDTTSYPGKLTLRNSGAWPTASRVYDGVEIVYVAGFGLTPDSVDSLAQRGIIVMAGYLYNHRGDGCEPMEAYRKSGAAELLSEYVRVRL